MMKLLFISADEDNGSVNELARRPVHAINASNASTCQAEHVLISAVDLRTTTPLLLNADKLATYDAVIVVKPTRIRGFSAIAREFAAVCQTMNTLCVTIPVDPEPGVSDALSEGLADLVLCVSHRQCDVLSKQRFGKPTKWIGHPVRECSTNEILHRAPVRRVLWENPVQCKPNYDVNASSDMDRFTGELVRLLARDHVQLLPWVSYGATQKDWETIVSSCDCGMECKTPYNHHCEFFRLKPATKVQNYMAGGLAVVCDSVEEYRILAQEGFALAFAATPCEFAAQIVDLYEKWELTVKASHANQIQVSKYAGIEQVTTRILNAVAELIT